jgi:NCS2 family nucleobase:cation symporter-2/xanthine permease XanP
LNQHDADTPLLFGLDERPPLAQSLTAAFAHLLAIVGGIATAPLLIAQGLALDVAQTTYLIASALIVSGIATFIQVYRFGPVGSGMLSVQGTSFAFVGVFIYAGLQLQQHHDNAQVLGILLGTAACGGICTMLAGLVLQRLQRIITLNVAGIVIFLLGLSLVEVAFNNLQFAASQAAAADEPAVLIWLQALVVIAAIAFFSSRKNPWLKLGSICLGLLMGVAFAAFTGGLHAQLPEQIDHFTFIRPAPFPLGFDGLVFLLLLPIFLVTITESIGDLTATTVLSGQPARGDAYWRRIRGGIVADGFNTTLAAMCGTFPNTTFSQNNGVIRLTGVASRFVGMLLAGLLLLLGCIPLVSALFQLLPGGVLHGATGLMFAMILFSGWRILRQQANQRRAMTMLVVATTAALLLTQTSWASAKLDLAVPQYVLLLTNFPVATGAVITMLWEALLPGQ